VYSCTPHPPPPAFGLIFEVSQERHLFVTPRLLLIIVAFALKKYTHCIGSPGYWKRVLENVCIMFIASKTGNKNRKRKKKDRRKKAKGGWVGERFGNTREKKVVMIETNGNFK
jgi:hypothetical protein